MKYFVFSTLIFFALCVNLHGQTYVRGDVSGTWTKANSPYIVENTITIQSNTILTIEPGVEIKFRNNGQIQIYGSLNAIGVENDTILFTHYVNHQDSLWSGILIDNSTTPAKFDYCKIEYSGRENKSGGAIQCKRTNMEINNSVIANNIGDYGGGICFNYSYGEILTIKNSTFINNESKVGGGLANLYTYYFDGPVFEKGKIEIFYCTFQNNRADKSGGAINGSSLKIVNCKFQNNNSNYEGSCIDASGICSIINSEFWNNTSSYSTINMGNSVDNFLVIHGISFIDNSSGIDSEANANISNSVFKNIPGSVFHFENACNEAFISNCAVYQQDIVQNPSKPTIYLRSDANNCKIHNSILVNANFGSTYGIIENNLNISYSNIEGGWSGIGNIDTEPLFVDPDNNDFQLQPSSPCIDSGHPSSIFNDWDGTRNDMGLIGGSGIFITPIQLDFGPLGYGQSKTKYAYFYNFRDTDFTLQSTNPLDNQNFSMVTSFPFTTKSLDIDTIEVEFHPQISGLISSQLIFKSQDLINSQTATLDLVGLGGIYSGNVSGTWISANSPYTIGGDITILENQTLTIESGVEVLIDTSYGDNNIEIMVYGNLIANGLENDSIIFKPVLQQEIAGIWEGIDFVPLDQGYLDKRFELEYCRISYATDALNLNTESPIINHCTISNNSQNGIVWNGLYEFYEDNHGKITDNHIKNNGRYGIYLRAHCGAEYGWAQPDVINNTIEYNTQGGIYLHAEGGRAGSTNLFSRNDHAYLRPKIEKNRIAFNGGFAIECYSEGRYNTIMSNIKHYSNAHVEPLIQRNICVLNEHGFRLRSKLFESYTLSFSNVKLKNNTFFNNSGDQIFVSDSTSNLNVYNNIFWDYTGNSIIVEGDANVHVRYNCFEFEVSDIGNISLDPQFIDRINNDFNIEYTSPCIDAGYDQSNKDPDSTRADMGAYYYYQSLSEFSLNYPENDSLITTMNPEFAWNNSESSGEEPITYNLYYSENASFADSVTSVVEGIINPQHELVEPLKDFSKYHWKVLAKNPWSLEKWSNENWSFSVNTDTVAPAFIADLPTISFDEDESLMVKKSIWYPSIYDKKTPDSLLLLEISQGKNISVTMKNDTVLFNSPENWYGTDTLQLTVTDFGYLKSSAPLLISINSVNDNPYFTNLPDSLQFFADSSTTFNIWDHTSDIETPDSKLSFSLNSSPDSVVAGYNDTTGHVTLTSAGYIGYVQLYIKATDEGMAFVSDSIQVRSIFRDILSPQIYGSLPLLTFKEDDSLSVFKTFWYPYVSDEATDDSLLIFDFVSGNFVDAAVHDSMHHFKAPENWFGSDTLTLTIKDLVDLKAESKFVVHVQSVNDVPEFHDLPDSISFLYDASYSLNIWDYTTDIETTDSLLSFDVKSASDSINIDYADSTGLVTLSSSGYVGATSLVLTATDDSSASVSDTILVSVNNPTGIDELFGGLLPTKYELFQNHPNPFNPTTTITFGLPETAWIQIEVFNIIGQKVGLVFEGNKSAGYHQAIWNAQNHSSGVYVYRLTAQGKSNSTLIKRMILLK